LRAFVTGANGFLGANLVRRLAAEGWEVRGLVRSTSDLTYLAGVDVDRVRGDLDSKEILEDACRDVDVLFHVAGLSSDWGPYDAFHRANVEGTSNVLVAGKGVPRIVHVSSAAVHGFSGYRDRRETDPTPPSRFPYVETKRVADAMALEHPNVVVVRPGNIFGRYDRITSVPMLKAMGSGWMGTIDGGRHLTCPTYVENLLDAMMILATAEGVSGAYLVTDGLEITWKEYVDELASALGVKPPRLSLPRSVAHGIAWGMEGMYRIIRSKVPPPLTRYRVANAGRDYHFSIGKAREELGWSPRIGFPEACRRTVEWFESRSRGP
jgi:nucleoside-diphosphate-sugar epimerase